MFELTGCLLLLFAVCAEVHDDAQEAEQWNRREERPREKRRGRHAFPQEELHVEHVEHVAYSKVQCSIITKPLTAQRALSHMLSSFSQLTHLSYC